MHFDTSYAVYILASRHNGTLYIGVTNNLPRRMYEHTHNLVEGFTERYAVHHLVWYEQTPDIQAAIRREKQMKKWLRKWKVDLIERSNPNWENLYADGIVLPLPIDGESGHPPARV